MQTPLNKPSKTLVAGLAVTVLAMVLVIPSASSAVVLNSSESVDINVTLNNQVASFNSTGLNLYDNNLYYFENQCEGNEAVDGIYPNGTLQCTTVIDEAIDAENLSETLTAGNVANQSIDMDNNNINDIEVLNSNGNNLQVGANLNVREERSIDVINGTYKLNDGDGDSWRFANFGNDGIQLTKAGTGVSEFNVRGDGDIYPQGDIKMKGSSNISNPKEIQDFFDTACSDGVVSGINDDGTYSCVDPDNRVEDVWVNESGDNVTGDLDLNNNDLIELDELRTDGSGSDVIAVRDTNAGNDIARFEEGGNVRIPNGDLILENNSVNSVGILRTQQLETGSGDSTLNIFDRENTAQLAEFNEGGSIQLRNSVNDEDALVVNPSGQSNVRLPNGNLDLSNNNITNYWNNNLCGEDRAVKEIHENGTVTCTDQIEFAADVDNLSQTLAAGNIANQSIDMSDNNLNNIGSLDFDNGNAEINNPSSSSLQVSASGGGTDEILAVRDAGRSSNVAVFGSAGSGSAIRNPLADEDIIRFNQSGGSNVEIPNGNLDVSGGHLDIQNAQNLRVYNSGSIVNQLSRDPGENTFDIRDSSQDVLRMVDGGDVEIPNGDLSMENNNIELVESLDSDGSTTNINLIDGGNVELPNGQLSISQTGEHAVFGNGNHAQHFIRFRNSSQFSSTMGYSNSIGNGATLIQSGDGKDLALAVDNASFGEGRTALIADPSANVDIPNGDLNLSDNTLQQVGNIVDSSGQNCGDNQFLDGDGNCQTDNDGTDDQNLSEVLVEGNTANQEIDMQDNNINDVGQINSNGQEVEVGGNINATGNNVEQVSRVDFESGDSATGTSGGDLCLGDRC